MTATPTTITFVTGNANKLAEVQAILAPTGIELASRALDLPELQGSIEEITSDKARRAAEAINGPVLVEDTCLCFAALDGLPGPYVKWFMASLGHDGLNNLLAAYDDKRATAVCTFAFCAGPGQDVVLFDGRTEGRIVPARGTGRFGWDAVFEYTGGKDRREDVRESGGEEWENEVGGREVWGLTYGEMDNERKNKVSHRGKALAKLRKWLQERK